MTGTEYMVSYLVRVIGIPLTLGAIGGAIIGIVKGLRSRRKRKQAIEDWMMNREAQALRQQSVEESQASGSHLSPIRTTVEAEEPESLHAKAEDQLVLLKQSAQEKLKLRMEQDDGIIASIIDDLFTTTNTHWTAIKTIYTRGNLQLLRDLSPILPEVDAIPGLKLKGYVSLSASLLAKFIQEAQLDPPCICHLYVLDSNCDPRELEKAGRISSREYLETGNVYPFYAVTCLACGATYTVATMWYHSEWWRWTPNGSMRTTTSG